MRYAAECMRDDGTSLRCEDETIDGAVAGLRMAMERADLMEKHGATDGRELLLAEQREMLDGLDLPDDVLKEIEGLF